MRREAVNSSIVSRSTAALASPRDDKFSREECLREVCDAHPCSLFARRVAMYVAIAMTAVSATPRFGSPLALLRTFAVPPSARGDTRSSKGSHLSPDNQEGICT